MRILALDTSTQTGSVAILDGELVIGYSELDPKQRAAQSLAPAIANHLRWAGWRPQDVELVAASQGPGSFTGLRLAVTTAKVFAYAVRAHVLGINTLEVIAAQAQVAAPFVWALMDAQRDQLFAAKFQRCSNGLLTVVVPTSILDQETWLHGLATGDGATGPGLQKMFGRLPQTIAVEDHGNWTPRATLVGQLAARAHALGKRDDYWSLAPAYHRQSAAEERLRG